MTPDEIVSHIPSITLADVHGALAYYFDHLAEIQQEMRDERTLSKEFRRSHPSLLESKRRQEAGALRFYAGHVPGARLMLNGLGVAPRGSSRS